MYLEPPSIVYTEPGVATLENSAATIQPPNYVDASAADQVEMNSNGLLQPPLDQRNPEAMLHVCFSPEASVLDDISSGGSVEPERPSIVNAVSGTCEQVAAEHTGAANTAQKLQNNSTAVKFESRNPSLDGQTQRFDSLPKDAPQGAPAVATDQGPGTSQSKPAGQMSALFKSKATAVVKEKRLGNLARFASQALADLVAQAEKYAASSAACQPLQCIAGTVWCSSFLTTKACFSQLAQTYRQGIATRGYMPTC